MTPFEIGIIVAATAIGALIFRMRGGLGPKLPRPIEQLLFSLPYGGITYLVTENWYIAAVVLALTTITVLKGHGNNMDLGTWTEDAEHEWYEKYTGYHKLDPQSPGTTKEYWYDVGGMAISGLTYTIPAGIATLNPFIALSGALKAPAYIIGWWVNGTELGEWLTGAFLWGSLATIAVVGGLL
jgi:hypothetical protein